MVQLYCSRWTIGTELCKLFIFGKVRVTVFSRLCEIKQKKNV